MNVATYAMGCLVLFAPLVASAGDASTLATKYSCQACHAVDKKAVGPSYKDIAAKYARDAKALDKLEKKVKGGSSGVWGPIPMPPNKVPDADLKALIEWILATK